MISDKAIVDKNFKIESSIEVGPFSVISKDVKIGKNTKIHSHVVITGDTNISEDCEIILSLQLEAILKILNLKVKKLN